MDRLDPDQAVFLLRQFGSVPGAALGSRDALIAYTLLHTLCHYWPSRATEAFSTVLKNFAYIKEEERSRFIKQRRILLKMLIRKFDSESEITAPVVTVSPSPQTPYHWVST